MYHTSRYRRKLRRLQQEFDDVKKELSASRAETGAVMDQLSHQHKVVENVFDPGTLRRKLTGAINRLQPLHDRMQSAYEEWCDEVMPSRQEIYQALEEVDLSDIRATLEMEHQSRIEDRINENKRIELMSWIDYCTRKPIMSFLFGKCFYSKPKLKGEPTHLCPTTRLNKHFEEIAQTINDNITSEPHHTLQFQVTKQFSSAWDIIDINGGYRPVDKHMGSVYFNEGHYHVIAYISYNNNLPVIAQPFETQNRLQHLNNALTLLHDDSEYATVDNEVMREIREYEASLQRVTETNDQN